MFLLLFIVSFIETYFHCFPRNTLAYIIYSASHTNNTLKLQWKQRVWLPYLEMRNFILQVPVKLSKDITSSIYSCWLIIWWESCIIFWNSFGKRVWFSGRDNPSSSYAETSWWPLTQYTYSMSRNSFSLGKVTFSNSLIINQVKTKKITTVKEVWIPGLN